MKLVKSTRAKAQFSQQTAEVILIWVTVIPGTDGHIMKKHPLSASETGSPILSSVSELWVVRGWDHTGKVAQFPWNTPIFYSYYSACGHCWGAFSNTQYLYSCSLALTDKGEKEMYADKNSNSTKTTVRQEKMMCWLKLQGTLASPTYSNYMLRIRDMKMLPHEHPLRLLGCFLLDRCAGASHLLCLYPNQWKSVSVIHTGSKEIIFVFQFQTCNFSKASFPGSRFLYFKHYRCDTTLL